MSKTYNTRCSWCEALLTFKCFSKISCIIAYPLLVSPIRLSSSPEASKVSGGQERAGIASSALAPLPVLPARFGIEFSTVHKNRDHTCHRIQTMLEIKQFYFVKKDLDLQRIFIIHNKKCMLLDIYMYLLVCRPI